MIWTLLEALANPTEWAVTFKRGELTIAPLSEVKGRLIERQLVK